MSWQLLEYFADLKLKQICQANPYLDALDCVTGPLALVSPTRRNMAMLCTNQFY
jgi:hypothetical protein